MIGTIFERLSQNPHALFTEVELRQADAEAFEDFARAGLVKRAPLDYDRATILRGGRVLRVISGPGDALIEAIDDEDIDFEPVTLTLDEVLAWQFDLAAWAVEFNSRHDIRGTASQLQDRIWQLGTIGRASLVFLVLPVNDSTAADLARSLPSERGIPPIAIMPPGVSIQPRTHSFHGVTLAQLTPGGFGTEPSFTDLTRATPTAGFAEPAPGFRHSVDFRSAIWDGQPYSFTPQQAQVVEMLLDAYLNGTPDLGQGYLLDRIGTTAGELRFTFRDNAAWGTLVVNGGTRGAFRLAL